MPTTPIGFLTELQGGRDKVISAGHSGSQDLALGSFLTGTRDIIESTRAQLTTIQQGDPTDSAHAMNVHNKRIILNLEKIISTLQEAARKGTRMIIEKAKELRNASEEDTFQSAHEFRECLKSVVDQFSDLNRFAHAEVFSPRAVLGLPPDTGEATPSVARDAEDPLLAPAETIAVSTQVFMNSLFYGRHAQTPVLRIMDSLIEMQGRLDKTVLLLDAILEDVRPSDLSRSDILEIKREAIDLKVHLAKLELSIDTRWPVHGLFLKAVVDDGARATHTTERGRR